MKQYDVVISGGAMAGMTLALALDTLCHGELSIAVVESFESDHSRHPGFDSRSIALSYGSAKQLKQWGLWAAIAPVATSINHIHVSDRGHAGMTSISREEIGDQALGYVVELADVGRIYHQLVSERPAITLYCPDSVLQLERSAQHVEIALSSGEHIRSRLLVAADGALSSSCDQVGLTLDEHDFDQVAIIANIRAQQPHHGQAFERFTETGPLALLPMSQERLSLVWCVKPDRASELLSLSDSAFLAQLQTAFGWRLGQLQQAGQRASYPLILRTRRQTIAHRIAVVGNAAQTLHPIAGQGFNLGIRDVATLAELIAGAPNDPGHYDLLSNYRQRRETDREQTIALTAGLVHTFSNDYLAMRIGRNLGLAAMEWVPPVKKPLLQRTLGLVAR
ncbi:2-octaprenyl-6-methoxyphenyl hydroxylase [Vibrio scophthalmi]|uniref:2-octaprenyl-6-methoxyphenyl hydroxylase n=1 Tax=Vibrio scophthalmi TaxID=45658 RepID=UPI002FEFF35E